VTLVCGPVNIPDPTGVKVIHIQTAEEMLKACQNALPTDIAICAAAVSDWRAKTIATNKIKKGADKAPPTLSLIENPDILRSISTHKTNRPALVIGFAAETENLIENARVKLAKKSCDWIIANNVAEDEVFGADENHVYLVTNNDTTEWTKASKRVIARDLTQEIINYFNEQTALKAAE